MADDSARQLPPLYTPIGKSAGPERAVMLQRYMVLHSQQSNARRRLSSSSVGPSSPPLSPRSTAQASPAMSEASSTASSPTLGGRSISQISPPVFALPKPTKRKTSSSRRPSMDPIPEDACLEPSKSLEPEEYKLFDINSEIKSTLTDLLNCEAVRNDSKMRLWVQTRLMEAERELKRQRKRRLSAPTIVISPSEEVDRRVSL